MRSNIIILREVGRSTVSAGYIYVKYSQINA